MADIGHPTPRLWYADWKQGLYEIAIAVQRVMRGETNNAGSATLAANVATTTVTDARVGANTKIVMMPTTANAAAEIGAGTIYVSSKADGSFVLTHANNAQADRAFDYILAG